MILGTWGILAALAAPPDPDAFVGPPAPVPVEQPSANSGMSPADGVDRDPSPLGRQVVAEARAVQALVAPARRVGTVAVVGAFAAVLFLGRRAARALDAVEMRVAARVLRLGPPALAGLWLVLQGLEQVPVLATVILLGVLAGPARVLAARHIANRQVAAPPPVHVTVALPAHADPDVARRVARVCPWVRAGSAIIVAPGTDGGSTLTVEAWSPAVTAQADRWLRGRLFAVAAGSAA